MKVDQCTVSYAPGGRSLRDIKAKTKVIARAIIYTTPANKEKKVTAIGIKKMATVIATLDIRHINSSV